MLVLHRFTFELARVITLPLYSCWSRLGPSGGMGIRVVGSAARQGRRSCADSIPASAIFGCLCPYTRNLRLLGVHDLLLLYPSAAGHASPPKLSLSSALTTCVGINLHCFGITARKENARDLAASGRK